MSVFVQGDGGGPLTVGDVLYGPGEPGVLCVCICTGIEMEEVL